ncbi:MAG: hypothetical protein WCH84_00700, partial [Verrucomicrobiota bacterium]
PYEDYVTSLIVVRHASDPIEERLKKDIEDCTKPRNLFDLVALYTNIKFFSSDTIAGTDAVTGNAVTSFNSQPDYNSPRLDNCTYDGAATAKPAVNVQLPKNNPLGGLFNAVRDTATVVRDTANTLTPAKSSGFYTRKDSLGELMMAWRDSSGLNRINTQCADSQASRLVPAAIAANVRLLELTFPRVAVEITEFDAKNKLLKCRMLSFEPNDKGEYDAKAAALLGYVPTCQASAIVMLKVGRDVENYWQPIAAVRAGEFDVKLNEIPNHKLLAYLNRDPKNPPDTAVTLAVGLDMAGVVVKSDDFNLQNLAITPAEVELAPSAAQLFRSSIVGTTDEIVWNIREKDGGTISADGNYKAPTTPGTYHVTAALKSDPTKNAVARVSVVVHEAVAVATKQTTGDVGFKTFKMQIDLPYYSSAYTNLYGALRYGFQYYYNEKEYRRGMPLGWAKIIYEGKENANSGSSDQPFWIYYAPFVSLQHRGNAVDDKLPADGSPFPAALRDIEAMHKSAKGTPQDVKIGDICCLMPSGFPDEFVAHAWRGPFYLDVRVQLKVGSRWSYDFLNSDMSKNDKRYAEAINIKNKAIADLPKVAMALASDAMNDLDTWCNRRVANGHGIKGLYNLPIDTKRYLPTPAELSKDISAGTYAGTYTYKIGNVEKASYTTTFSATDITEADESATAPINSAHTDFEARVKYNTGSVYATPEKISIPGADEAVEFKANPDFSRGDARRFHRIMFRVANVYVTVDSSYQSTDFAPQSPHGNQLAKLIIAKLTKR